MFICGYIFAFSEDINFSVILPVIEILKSNLVSGAELLFLKYHFIIIKKHRSSSMLSKKSTKKTSKSSPRITQERSTVLIRVMIAEVQSRIAIINRTLNYLDNLMMRYLLDKEKDCLIDCSKRYLTMSRQLSALEMVNHSIMNVSANAYNLVNQENLSSMQYDLIVLCCAAKIYNFDGFFNFIRSIVAPVIGSPKVQAYSSPKSLTPQQTNLFFNHNFLQSEAVNLIYEAAKFHKVDKKIVDNVFGYQEPPKLYYPSPDDIGNVTQQQKTFQNDEIVNIPPYRRSTVILDEVAKKEYEYNENLFPINDIPPFEPNSFKNLEIAISRTVKIEE